MNSSLDDKISQLDDLLIKNHGFDNQLFERLTNIQKELGILHDDRPICPFLRPHFLSKTKYSEIKSAVEELHLACETLTEAALNDPLILAEINLTEKEERMARIDPRYKSLCVSSRFDTYLHGEDFKFLEYNAETPAGVGDQLSFQKVFEDVPEVQDFLRENPHWQPQPHIELLQSLDLAYRQTGGKKEKPNIAIVDWEGVSTYAEFEILRDHWNSQGYQTIITTPFEFEYDGKVLRVKDFEVDIFYKRVIIHEFLEHFDETHPLVRAYSDGNVCMANNFRVKIPHKKTSFAILSDEKYEYLFTPKQQELIRKHIPWTRRVREIKTTFDNKEVDLLKLIRVQREKFILKPHDDYGGHGIKLGWECSESEWDEAIQNALNHCFIVQEKVGVDKIQIPTFSNHQAAIETLNIDFDPYLFNGKMHGGMVRLSAKSLVNITQGGGETALVIMEDN